MIIELLLLAISLIPLAMLRGALEFVFRDFPDGSWAKLVGFSIGPTVPLSGAPRATVFRVSRAWLLAGVSCLTLGWVSWYTPRFLAEQRVSVLEVDVACMLLMSVSIYVGLLCLMESVWVLLRLRSAHEEQPCSEVTIPEPTRPPNNTMNPTAGGRRPPASLVTLARRGLW